MKIRNQFIKIMFAITLALTVFSCDDNNNVEIAKLPTILEITQADPASFSTLSEALKRTQLLATASNPGSITVFAPTNTAFAAYVSPSPSTAFPTGITLTSASPALTAAQETELRNLLRNHILGVGAKSSDLIASTTVSGYFKTFAAGPGSGSSATTLSMFVNQKDGNVLINGGATNGGAKVIKADIDASNGIVHVVDNVIKLPKILNHVIANPDLSTLVTVVTSTGGTFGNQAAVATALGGNGPLTVFAPLNSAFTTATTGTGFLTGANVTEANVTKVLQYHVSSTGNLTSSSATSWNATSDATITTLVTPAQTFIIPRGTVKIKESAAITNANASNIKFVNIQATNGVIHTIDRVLQPVF